MKQELIEIITKDNISLMGIYFSPSKKSPKTVIHVHGYADNFYQSKFIRELAKMYASIGYNFLSFNNRGHDYATILIKDNKITRGGSYNELFSASVIDIEAAINFVKDLGTTEVILEGHSLGCCKVVNYFNETKSDFIKNMILLAPSDVTMKVKQIMKDGYDGFLAKARELVLDNKPNEVLYHPHFFPQNYTAQTFLENYAEYSRADIFRYRDKEYVSSILKEIKIPILIQIGTADRMAFISDKDDISPFWKRNNDNNTINFIKDANHEYFGHEHELCEDIKKWLGN